MPFSSVDGVIHYFNLLTLHNPQEFVNCIVPSRKHDDTRAVNLCKLHL